MYAEKLFLKLPLSLLDSAAFKLSVRIEDHGFWGKSMPDICHMCHPEVNISTRLETRISK